MKPIVFLGTSRKDLKDFPTDARNRAGFELYRVQLDLEPSDWKPMKSVAAGVREIRVRDRTSAFRVLYVAHIGDKIFVLHCFQRKSQATAQRDIELAQARFKEIEV